MPMRMVFDATRRFPRRPHYDKIELDRECETIATDLLFRKRGHIEYPLPTEDLWTLLEEVTDDVDIADLGDLGEEVHGVTLFRRTGRPRVKIERELTLDERRVNRLRTTLTHEFGHVKFHGFLFALEAETGLLFAEIEKTSRDPICKRDAILGNTTDWMEWQAGYVSGAILMPATAVRETVAATIGTDPTPLPRDDRRVELLAYEVRERFGTSADAARTRLTKLGYVAPAASMVALPT